MNLFAPRQPLPDPDLQWVHDGFERLAQIIGKAKLAQCDVILPTDHYFPDSYGGDLLGVQKMALRIAGYMQIPPSSFEVALYASPEHTLRKEVPHWSGRSCDAAGLYFHQPEDGVYTIGIHADQLSDPIRVGATLAHELAHVMLLGGGLLDRDAEDMEPLTDLATVYLGLGVLSASAAFQFRQWTNNRTQGWSVRRQGYLPEPVWAYALARFAYLRNEQVPSWAQALPGNIRSEYRSAAKWLRQRA